MKKSCVMKLSTWGGGRRGDGEVRRREEGMGVREWKVEGGG